VVFTERHSAGSRVGAEHRVTGRKDGGQRLSTCETVEVADGVFAYLQLDGGWCLNNAGVIIGDAKTVLVDTAATITRAQALRATVERLGGGQSLTIVNTHHHGDHCFGNGVFDRSATIIAHDRTSPELAEGGLGLCGLWPDVEWGDIQLRLPDVTYSTELTLHTGRHEVRLIHPGPAHTTNDTVVLLPAERVLFGGDIVWNGVTPFVLMGSVAGSIAAIERLAELPVSTVVPGHGPLGGPELLDQTVAYLRWVQELASAGRLAGLTPLETACESNLGAFAGLIDSERLVGNLVRAFAELDDGPLGEPVDVLGAFGQMIEYHGGLPACLA
jgi:cyclase